MNVKEKLAEAKSVLEQASPTIKIVGGVVGLLVAGVWAAVASTKFKEKTQEEHKMLEDINKLEKSKNNLLSEEEKVSDDISVCYSDPDRRKDVVRLIVCYAKKMVILYGIPFGLAILSVLAILNGTHVLNTRVADGTALLALTTSAFESYRDRVRNRFGEEVENELYYDAEYKTRKEKVVDENGEEKTVTKKELIVKNSQNKSSLYSFLFDESCLEWTNDIDYNTSWLRGIQSSIQNELDYKKAYITFGELNSLLERKINPEDKEYQLISMRCGWRHGDKVDLRIQRVFVSKEENGKRISVPYCLINPNVHDIYAELVKENEYHEATSV